jgi:molecular chaperone DnaK
MARCIGVDLGTTNTVMFHMHTAPQVILNKENASLTPSVVALKKGKKTGESILVGQLAEDYSSAAGKDYLYSVKRLIGRGYEDKDVQKMLGKVSYEILPSPHGKEDVVRIKLGDKLYEPKEISAMVINKMKKDAEFRLNAEVDSAVITVPAYFSERQKHATREAGLLSGLRVKRVIDEPSAAAIAYGIDQKDGEDRMVLVYDLGGGTFDVSILLMVGGTFQPMTNEGNMWLGGNDFDDLIVDWVVRQIKEDEGVDVQKNSEVMFQIRKKACAAKEMLSAHESANIIISELKDEDGLPLACEYELTRSEFNTMIAPSVKDSMKIVEAALKSAELTSDDIDIVLMVGGSSTIPLVQDTVAARFGKEKVMRNIDPMTCVAQGAAILAKNLSDKTVWCACGEENTVDNLKCRKCGLDLSIVIQEVEDKSSDGIDYIGGITAKPYGIEVEGGGFIVIIPKGSEYPTQEPFKKIFETVYPGQTLIKLPVFEGFSEKACDNELMGNIWFKDLPKGLPEGTDLEVSIGLDGDMVLTIGCKIRDLDWSKTMTLEHGGWVPAALDKAAEAEQLLQNDQLSKGKKEELRAIGQDLQNAIEKGDEKETKKILDELDKVKGEIIENVPPPPDDWKNNLSNQLAWVKNNYEPLKPLLDDERIKTIVQPLTQWIDDVEIALRDDDEISGRELYDKTMGVVLGIPIVSDMCLADLLPNVPEIDPVTAMRLRQARTDLLTTINTMDAKRIPEAMNELKEQVQNAMNQLGGNVPMAIGEGLVRSKK